MTFLQKIITRELETSSDKDDAVAHFDLYNPTSVQALSESMLEKSVCDCDGRHLGFVSDIMISTWNNKPEYILLDAKLKPWHLRNAQFLYPIASITEIGRVKINIKDQRATVYESSAFDPQVVELQETFPLISLKSLEEYDDVPATEVIDRYNTPAQFWADGLW